MKKNFMDTLVQQLNKPPLSVKVNFFRLLAVAQNAWLGIRESLVSINSSESNKTMKDLVNGMISSLTEWASLAEAMEEYDYFFKSEEIELVRSAQITGNMAKVVGELSQELERDEEVNWKISKALSYPIMILAIAVVAVVVVLVYVMPSIVEMFVMWDAELPGITQFMLKVSDFFKENWHIVLIILVSISAGYKIAYSRFIMFKIFIDTLFVKVPVIWDVVKMFYMYKFSNLLSQFYEAWVSPVVSLNLLANIFDNFNYKKKMLDAKSDLESGYTLYEALSNSYLFDPILVQIINVWESTWSLTGVLSKMASFYHSNFSNTIDTATSLIQPIFMVVIASVVGVIVASIYLPMADMMQAVQNL